MYCTNCGKEIDGSSNFCVNCGKVVKEENYNINNKKRGKKNNIIIRWVLFAFFIIYGIGALSFSYGGLLILLAGFIISPLLDVLEKMKINLIIRIIIVVILTLIGFYISGMSTKYKEYENNMQINEQIAQEEKESETKMKEEEKAKKEEEKEEAEKQKEKEKVEEEEQKEREKIEAKEKLEQEKKQQMQDYKSNCQSLNYDEIARNPENYKYKNVTFTGEVIQVQEGFWDGVTLLINVTKGEYGFYEDTIYCTYTYSEGEDKILEGDIIKIYGECQGDTSYLSVLGQKITVPKVEVKYVELQRN